MQIRLPRLPRWAVRFIHWINRPLVGRISRIDALLVATGIGVGAYYWYAGGPILALQGVAMYGFVLLVILLLHHV